MGPAGHNAHRVEHAGGQPMKVLINQSGCVGHARCNNVAPALYPLDDNGYIASRGFSVPIAQEGLAKRGARACPERVIEVLETSGERP